MKRAILHPRNRRENKTRRAWSLRPDLDARTEAWNRCVRNGIAWPKNWETTAQGIREFLLGVPLGQCWFRRGRGARS